MNVFEQNTRLIERCQMDERTRIACGMYILAYADQARCVLRSALDVDVQCSRLDLARRILNDQLKRCFTFHGLKLPAELLADPRD